MQLVGELDSRRVVDTVIDCEALADGDRDDVVVLVTPTEAVGYVDAVILVESENTVDDVFDTTAVFVPQDAEGLEDSHLDTEFLGDEVAIFVASPEFDCVADGVGEHETTLHVIFRML